MLPLSHSRVTVPFVRGGLCSANCGKFDETYPTALLNHVSPVEWQQTIQAVNAAIQPPKLPLVINRISTASYAVGVGLMLWSVLFASDLGAFGLGFLVTLVSLMFAIPSAVHLNNSRTANLNRAVYTAHSHYMSRFPQSAWTVQSAHQLRYARVCIDLMSNPQPQSAAQLQPGAPYYSHPQVGGLVSYAQPATAPELSPSPPQTPHVTYYNQYSQYPTVQVDHNNIRQPLINY